MRARAVSGDVAGACASTTIFGTCSAATTTWSSPLTRRSWLLRSSSWHSFAHCPARSPLPFRSLPRAPRRSSAISVPAFATQALDPDKAHLVTGFRQYLIASLVRFREWQVTDVPFEDHSAEPGGGPDGRYEVVMNVYQSQSSLNLLSMLKEQNTAL